MGTASGKSGSVREGRGWVRNNGVAGTAAAREDSKLKIRSSQYEHN